MYQLTVLVYFYDLIELQRAHETNHLQQQDEGGTACPMVCATRQSLLHLAAVDCRIICRQRDPVVMQTLALAEAHWGGNCSRSIRRHGNTKTYNR